MPPSALILGYERLISRGRRERGPKAGLDALGAEGGQVTFAQARNTSAREPEAAPLASTASRQSVSIGIE